VKDILGTLFYQPPINFRDNVALCDAWLQELREHPEREVGETSGSSDQRLFPLTLYHPRLFDDGRRINDRRFRKLLPQCQIGPGRHNSRVDETYSCL